MSDELIDLPDHLIPSDCSFDPSGKQGSYQGHRCSLLTGRVQFNISEQVTSAIKALVSTLLPGLIGLFSQLTSLCACIFFSTRQVKADVTEKSLVTSKLINSKLSIGSKQEKNNSSPIHVINNEHSVLSKEITKAKALQMMIEGQLEYKDLPSHLKQDANLLLELYDRDKSGGLVKILAISKSTPVFDDESFLLELIQRHPSFILLASTKLIANREFLLKASGINPEVIHMMPLPSVHAEDRELELVWIKERLDTFGRIAPYLKLDAFFFYQLKETNPLLEDYLTCEASNFTNDEKLLDLIEMDSSVFNLLPEEKRMKEPFLIQVANKNIESFNHFPVRFKQDEAFVLKLIDHLSEASLKEFMEVLANGENPLYLNSIVVGKLVEKRSSLRDVHPKLLEQRDFLLKALNVEDIQIGDDQYLPRKFAHDKEVMLKWMAVRGNPPS